MRQTRYQVWLFVLLLAAPLSRSQAQPTGAAGPSPGAPAAAPAAGEVMRLTLEESLRQGMAHNLQIRAAEAKLEATRGQAMSARSNFFPKLNASATIARTNNLPTFTLGKATYIPTSFPVANSSGDPATPADHIHLVPFPSFEITNTREGNIYGAKVELTAPFYTGGRIYNGYQAAKLETTAQDEEIRRLKLDTIYQVKQAFYGVLLAQAMVKVVDQSYATVAAHYKRVQDLYRQGMVSNLDLLQVEAQLASIRPQQIMVHNGLELAKLRLLAVMNLDLDTNLEVAGELAYDPVPIEELAALKQRADQERPEMRGLGVRIDQTIRMKKVAQAGYLPTAGGFANYQWNRGQDMPPNDTIWREGWQVGASLTVPLFDGLNTRGQVRNAQGTQDQLLMSQAALRAGIEAEVTAAVLTLRASEEKMVATQVSVQAAEKNFKVAEDRYAVGMVNHLDVMDAEVLLTTAQANSSQAVNDCLVARANLDKAIGRMEEVSQ